MNLPIEFAPQDKRPMYQQLFDALAKAIRSGQLKVGDHLPSTRELAATLGLARGTVVHAYDELLNQGLVMSKTGTSTKIVAPFADGAIEQSSLAVSNAGASARVDGQLSRYGKRLLELAVSGHTSGDLPALNYGCTPKDLLPLKQWRELLSRHCRMESSDTLRYVTEPFGYRPLREGVSNYLTRTKAVRCHPDQVIIFSGSQQALDNIVSVLIDPQDKVVVENPGYVGIRERLLAQGAQLEPIEVDQNGMRVDLLGELESDYKLIHTTPAGHDPTGVQMSSERRSALLALAKKKGCLILEDAWDTDYVYGPAVPSLQGSSDEQSVIYLYSLFKVLYPLTTLTVAVIPVHLIPVFTRAKLLSERQVPALAYCALSDFIEEGHLDAQIRRTQKIYQKRRQLLMFALTASFRDNIKVSPKSAGLHLTVQFKPELSQETIVHCATQASLSLVCTRPYYVNNPRVNEFLLAFSNIPEADIAAQVQKFADLLFG